MVELLAGLLVVSLISETASLHPQTGRTLWKTTAKRERKRAKMEDSEHLMEHVSPSEWLVALEDLTFFSGVAGRRVPLLLYTSLTVTSSTTMT